MEEKEFKLVRARLMLPMSDRLGRDKRIEDGFVLIQGSKIIDVGKYEPGIGEKISAEYGSNLHVIGMKKTDGLCEKDIPCINGVILPCFVKAHGHDHESPIIGVAKDEPLTSWLDHAVNLFSGFMDEKREDLEKKFGTSPNFVTYIKARLDDTSYGITSSMNHHCNFNKYRVQEIVEANTLAGTKMIVAVGGQDRNYDPRILDTPECSVKRLDEYVEKFGSTERISIIPGPDQVFSNGPEQLKALKSWARDKGSLIHIHSSEEPGTTKWFTEKYGMTPVEYLKDIDFIDSDTVLAHQVNNTPNDLEIIKESGAIVVHNPLANTILGSGMPPVVKMLEMGIPVVISTDGSGSADNQNILAAARCASQYQKANLKDASLLPAQKLLEMITVDPANMLRLNTGSLEKDKDADVIVIDLTKPNMTPTRVDNVVENLIWSSNGSETRYVIANGKILMDDFKFCALDAEKIKHDVFELSRMFAEYKEVAEEIRGTGVHK
ncbi:5'-deoxyadenosine deaminase [subsurface metagenome]